VADGWLDLAASARFSAQKLTKVSLAESERLLFDLYCLEPGQAQKVHSHDGIDKVYVVLSGLPTVQLGDESRPLGPGLAAYAAAGLPHGVRNDGSERATLLVFQARSLGPTSVAS
jgi:mannose-6-phosphate isomerase-like protein (cupin superfamily)